jgi:protein ImuA
MPGSRRHRLDALDSLRHTLARLETRPLLAAPVAAPTQLLAPPPGHVHEVCADSPVAAGAALGFALAQAQGLRREGRPGLVIAQLRGEAQELGLPYGAGFAGFGLAPEAVTLIRAETIAELLWALEEALACRAVAAVIAELARPHKALDFTASRRLALRSAASGGSVFLTRYGPERTASAARYRWRVMPRPSRPAPGDARAPGGPRWQITLEKGRLSAAPADAPEGETYLVDWTEHGFVIAAPGGRKRPRSVGGAALPRALPAALGHRLSQAG